MYIHIDMYIYIYIHIYIYIYVYMDADKTPRVLRSSGCFWESEGSGRIDKQFWQDSEILNYGMCCIFSSNGLPVEDEQWKISWCWKVVRETRWGRCVKGVFECWARDCSRIHVLVSRSWLVLNLSSNVRSLVTPSPFRFPRNWDPIETWKHMFQIPCNCSVRSQSLVGLRTTTKSRAYNAHGFIRSQGLQISGPANSKRARLCLPALRQGDEIKLQPLALNYCALNNNDNDDNNENCNNISCFELIQANLSSFGPWPWPPCRLRLAQASGLCDKKGCLSLSRSLFHLESSRG